MPLMNTISCSQGLFLKMVHMSDEHFLVLMLKIGNNITLRQPWYNFCQYTNSLAIFAVMALMGSFQDKEMQGDTNTKHKKKEHSTTASLHLNIAAVAHK